MEQVLQSWLKCLQLTEIKRLIFKISQGNPATQEHTNTLYLLVNDIHKEQSSDQDKLRDQASFNFQIDASNIFSGEKEANLVLKNPFYYISKCHYKGNITNIISETRK